MNAQNITKNAKTPNFTRREFLRAGSLAVSGVGVGFGATRLLGLEGAKPIDIPNIDPGYIGPQFFDKREEEALLEVLESRSPFRYWGPGTPTKVLRFEEGFAQCMGA
ncbi:MAG: hypothetical protein JXN61_07910, partial [Sedimentisphaerales bacterium]|nr:hypothetical protein [Sedimentisphaerales bacterium]